MPCAAPNCSLSSNAPRRAEDRHQPRTKPMMNAIGRIMRLSCWVRPLGSPAPKPGLCNFEQALRLFQTSEVGP